jgi:hypothetical protein
MRYFPNEYIESNSLVQRLSNSTNQFINKCNVIFIFPLHLRQQKNIATVSCVFSNELTGINEDGNIYITVYTHKDLLNI